MKPIKFIPAIILFIGTSYLLSSCSSSSYSERYNEHKSETKTSPSKKVRFSSEDDTEPAPAANDSVSEQVTFNDTADDSTPEFDEVPVEEYPVDTKEFVEHYSKLRNFNVALTDREKILFEVIKYIDTPYHYGGKTLNGIDCSAFTEKVFQNSVALNLPRTTKEQYKMGEKISSREDLKFGDLVFFNTRRRNNPGHVGIYLGEDKFVHASRSLGVTVSSLQDAYYSKRFAGGRRVDDVK